MITTKTAETKATKTTYQEPGEGAIEFARQYVDGMTRQEAKPIIDALLRGEVHEKTDKRIKRCDYCGYWWRDDSLRNTRRTCSDECKRGIKTLQRRQQRADAELLNPKPKKKTKRDSNYIWWLEYPFWLNEYEMLKNTWKYDVPYAPAKLGQICASKQRDEIMGGKRKPKRVIPYNGNEAEQSKVFVKYVSDKDKTKPSEVVTTIISNEEIENYFSSKYSKEHLRMERFRATTWRNRI